MVPSLRATADESLPAFHSKPRAVPEVDGSAPPAVAPPNDDPEKNAGDFVERNRKVAQDELKKLKDEAEQLRARLAKVEAGIRRWEGLVAALDQGDKAAAMLKPAPPPNATPVLRDAPPPPVPR